MASQAGRSDRAYFYTDYMDLKDAHDVYVYENRQEDIVKYTIVVIRDGGIFTINRPYIDATAVYEDTKFKPFAVAFSKDKFYVTATKTIQLFDSKFKRQDTLEDKELISPKGIYAGDNRLYVVNGKHEDPSNKTAIFIFDLDMKKISKFAEGNFVDPWSLKVNLTETMIFVSDTGAREVKIFDNERRKLVRTIPMPQHGGRQMQCRGLDIDENDNVFVALRVEGLRRQYECIRMYPKGVKYSYIFSKACHRLDLLKAFFPAENICTALKRMSRNSSIYSITKYFISFEVSITKR
ncbi:putative E3 ubiquitin-protein ligase TRIM71-like isoform X1 [Apostichopus japonicus]|uniref:Putative E3 ubiquitin-protein ligase TRIM71-like isoform X1 n=1 Tax=Stichopus japonicus TaxID=307972 RepID=A0A2G8LPW5_STIJA|nr:putative E3 ubiquitin-protein ligase TRIM71-like isoform X1 [Apostichopus japonicus]